MSFVAWEQTFKKDGTAYTNAAVSIYLAGTTNAARIFDMGGKLYDSVPQIYTDRDGHIKIQFDPDDYSAAQLFDIVVEPWARCDIRDNMTLNSLMILQDTEGNRKFKNVFAQASAPTSGMRGEDVWFDTDDNNHPYWYDGTDWISMRDGGTILADRIDAGTITSKIITLALSGGSGDVALKCGKTDFGDTTAGFILGIDDSDDDQEKFEIGDANSWFRWAGSSLDIKLASGEALTISDGGDIELIGSDTDPGIIKFSGSSYDFQFGATADGKTLSIKPSANGAQRIEFGGNPHWGPAYVVEWIKCYATDFVDLEVDDGVDASNLRLAPNHLEVSIQQGAIGKIMFGEADDESGNCCMYPIDTLGGPPTGGEVWGYLGQPDKRWARVYSDRCYGTFHDRGDPASADYTQATLTLDSSWNDLDLSGIVPTGAKAVALRVVITAGTGKYILFRRNGNSNIINISQVTQGSLTSTLAAVGDLVVPCDANQVIEYYGTGGTLEVTVKGWWF